MRAILVLALLSSNVSAALLGEWSWQNPNPLTAPALYRINSTNFSPFGLHAWESHSASLHETFQAPQQTVDAFDLAWTTGLPGTQSLISMLVFDKNGWQSDYNHRFGTDIDWAMEVHDSPGWNGQRYAPDLGIAFFGYKIQELRARGHSYVSDHQGLRRGHHERRLQQRWRGGCGGLCIGTTWYAEGQLGLLAGEFRESKRRSCLREYARAGDVGAGDRDVTCGCGHQTPGAAMRTRCAP